MSFFDYQNEKEFQEEVQNLFEEKKRLSKKDMIDFLKKDINKIEIKKMKSQDQNDFENLQKSHLSSKNNEEFIKKLEDDLDKAYKSNAPQNEIDDLETKLANFISDEDSQYTEEDPTVSDGISVEEQLRIMYDRYIHPEKRSGMETEDIIANMRSIVQDAGGRKDVTDEELLDAAKDAYENFKKIKRSRGYEVESSKLMDRLLDEDEIVEESQIPVKTGVNMIVAGGGGENNSIVVVGDGVSLYKDKVGPDLRIKSLSATGSTSLIDVGDLIVISSTDVSGTDSWIEVSANYYSKLEIDNRTLEDLYNVSGIPQNYSMLNYVSSVSAWSATDVQWDDMLVPATQLKQGATSKPDFDYTNIGLLFPQNDSDEKAYLSVQFSHKRKNGSDIAPHLHFIQTTSALPVWVLQYRWYNNGSIVPSFTTVSATSGVFPYTSGSMMQIMSFPRVNGTSISAVSSQFDGILWRQDNIIIGDVLLKQFDIHYQSDSYGGSLTEYVK